MSFLPPQIKGVYPVTGVPVAKGEKPGVRLELRELKKDDHSWRLFLMGLWALQKVPQYRDLSYYQLGAIHGKPYTPWPQGDAFIASKQKEQIGFCTHTSILFLPWHRPYLALYEQVIHLAMKYIAEKATPEEGKAKYVAALKTWRLPYWDWAVTGQPVFPDEFLNETLPLPLPLAARVEYGIRSKDEFVDLQNPLNSYYFGTDTHPDVLMLGTHQTERYGKDEKDETKRFQKSTPEERKKGLYAALNPYSREVNSQIRPEGNLRERVVYLLQAYHNFKQVSHNQWDPERKPFPPGEQPKDSTPETLGQGFGSFEDIHNTVHGLVGGEGNFKGHMADVQLAGFDPVFWLHHCNVDRLGAIWQALHNDDKDPNTYVVDSKSVETSWSTSKNDIEGLKTPLYPFYENESGKFWDAEGVKDTTKLGYVYPETKDWRFGTKDVTQHRVAILEALELIYPNSSLANMMINVKFKKEAGAQSETVFRGRGDRLKKIQQAGKVTGARNTLASLAVVADNISDEHKANIQDILPTNVKDDKLDKFDNSKLSLLDLASDDTYWEYMFNIKAEKHALDGNYGLHVFIGPVEEENVALYTVSPNHVGTFTPFGQKQDTECTKCQTDMAAHQAITGQIPLTIALVERYFAGFIADLEPQTVINHLSQHLHWELVNSDGERLTKQRDRLDGLKVSVSSNEVTLPKEYGELHTYSDTVRYLYGITTDKEGNGRGEGTGMTYKDFYGKEAWERGEGIVVQGGDDDAEEGT